MVQQLASFGCSALSLSLALDNVVAYHLLILGLRIIFLFTAHLDCLSFPIKGASKNAEFAQPEGCKNLQAGKCKARENEEAE